MFQAGPVYFILKYNLCYSYYSINQGENSPSTPHPTDKTLGGPSTMHANYSSDIDDLLS